MGFGLFFFVYFFILALLFLVYRESGVVFAGICFVNDPIIFVHQFPWFFKSRDKTQCQQRDN